MDKLVEQTQAKLDALKKPLSPAGAKVLRAALRHAMYAGYASVTTAEQPPPPVSSLPPADAP